MVQLTEKRFEETGIESDSAIEHIMQRNVLEDVGHLSIQKTTEILTKQINLNLCKQITLCHLSATNSSKYFASKLQKSIGENISVIQLPVHEVVTTIINEIKEEY